MLAGGVGRKRGGGFVEKLQGTIEVTAAGGVLRLDLGAFNFAEEAQVFLSGEVEGGLRSGGGVRLSRSEERRVGKECRL